MSLNPGRFHEPKKSGIEIKAKEFEPIEPGITQQRSAYQLELELEQQRLAYQDLVRSFFRSNSNQHSPGDKHKIDFYAELRRQIEIEICLNGFEIPKDQAIFIANHPCLDDEFHISDELLPVGHGLYPKLHFPGIFQLAWHQLISSEDSSRQFATVIRDIGYDKYLNLLDCFILPPENGTQAIAQELISNKNKSVVMYPEGGFKNLKVFSKGFYHVARAANIKKVVVCHLTPNPKLGGSVVLTVLDVIAVPNFGGDDAQIRNWINGTREAILGYQNKKGFV